MKEIMQEVTRIQTYANLIGKIKEKEEKKIQLKPESVKVSVFFSILRYKPLLRLFWR